MKSVESVIELLEKIKRLGKLCIGGEQSPNSEECFDAIVFLRSMLAEGQKPPTNNARHAHKASTQICPRSVVVRVTGKIACLDDGEDCTGIKDQCKDW